MNNIEKDVKILKPFTKFCISIGELPSSYLESMSYYEMLLWFTRYLEKTVIPAINQNGEAVAELQNLFIELRNYVDNYFSSTDFQQLVNNKLDSLVEDGTLERLIGAYIDEYIEHSFLNVLDMKYENIEADVKCRTMGYHSVNDGGGASYIIRDEEPSTYYELMNNGKYAELIIEDVVNVKQFGAYGDGIHEDTNSIQTAIANNNNVYFPKGTYLTGQIDLKEYTKIFGNKETILEFKENIQHCIVISGDFTEVSNLKLKCENNTNGIYCLGIKHININNCEIQDFNYGLRLKGAKDLVIENNIIHDGKFDGILLYQDSDTATINALIKGNTVFNIFNNDETNPLGEGISVYGFTNTTTDPYTFAENITVTDNVSYNNGRDGILFIGVKNSIISSNHCYNITKHQNGVGICLSEACVDVVIDENISRDNNVGITCDIATKVRSDIVNYGRIVISNNIISNNNKNGIVTSNSPQSVIVGNQITGSNSIGITCNERSFNNLIANNKIDDCYLCGIRLTASEAQDDDSQSNNIISNNNIINCGQNITGGNTYAGIYISKYFKNTQINNNNVSSPSYALSIRTNDDVSSKGNKLTGKVYIETADTLKIWNDDLSNVDTITSTTSGGNLISNPILIKTENDIVPTFGLSSISTRSNENPATVSNIQNGTPGKILAITNLQNSIVLSGTGGNIKNKSNQNVTLANGESVIYKYYNNLWYQL